MQAMEAAAILAIVLQDYTDFALILALLVLNATISYVEESNAVGVPCLPFSRNKKVRGF